MQQHADKKRKTTKQSSVGAALQRKQDKKSAFTFQDNRPQATIQRKLQDQIQNRVGVRQLKRNMNISKSNQVIQFGGSGSVWTKEKAKDFRKWVRERAAKRYAKGKRKPSEKLVRKYIKARMRADKTWTPSMADAPTAGHHAPPIAVSNKHQGGFVYGKRGSATEKARDRLYFTGTKKQRQAAHWIAHEAEAIQGINRMTNFKGTDRELAIKMLLAHNKLTLSDKTRIKVERRSQNDASTGMLVPIGKATRFIMQSRIGNFNLKFDTDDDNSEPEINFKEIGVDSDTFDNKVSKSKSQSSSDSSNSESDDSDVNMTAASSSSSESEHSSDPGSDSGSGSSGSDYDTNSGSSGSDYDTNSGTETEYNSNSGSSSSGTEYSTEQDTEMSNSSSSDSD
ncbi:MAG: hypothetical protein AAF611_05020 [Bacteroidota bacterium]